MDSALYYVLFSLYFLTGFLSCKVQAWNINAITLRTTGTTNQFKGGRCMNRNVIMKLRQAKSWNHAQYNNKPRTSSSLMMSETPYDENINFDEGQQEQGGERVLSDDELEATMGKWDDKIPRLNILHLTGRIGNDPPELKYLDSGKVVLNLSLATQAKVHPKARKQLNIPFGEEGTLWYGLELWGATAEFASKFVEKGTRVGVVGSLKIDEWADKTTGEMRCATKVVVNGFDILETRDESDLRRSKRGGGTGGGFSNARGPPRDSNTSNRGGNSKGKREMPPVLTSDDYDDGEGNDPAGTGGFFS